MTGQHREAVERLYTDVCDISVSEKFTRANGTKGFRDSVIVSGAPCRLSFKNVYPAGDAAPFAPTAQAVKLFIAPEAEIPPGSVITVTRCGRTITYKRSGAPSVYESHQEVPIELSDERA